MSHKTSYSAYAGLGRTAMWKGMPLIPTLIVLCIATLAGLIGAAVFGAGGLAFALPAVPVVLFFKHMCATDDEALRILGLEFRCVIDRRNTRCFGNTYTLSPMRYGRTADDARRAFAAHTPAAQRMRALAAMLSARGKIEAAALPSERRLEQI